jgi:hypothetical protein
MVLSVLLLPAAAAAAVLLRLLWQLNSKSPYVISQIVLPDHLQPQQPRCSVSTQQPEQAQQHNSMQHAVQHAP